ncbi:MULTISPECIES: hypothetical protein [unclassified Fibrobacter]|uniref:hypothetical protein n=1 Tax=unclassified Fibrobacter TaxID=2634177 RepID=UPI000D7A5443|nr:MULTISPECIES: hypothetical protein [unclassified Fibrobacter]PWJ71986.1 hypothetical protein BGX12_101225 [Fibrobacter sp. UWR4]PZW62327.1 hypothetical protein C8E88_10647 [Fibrobacter sp. UWR1]
MRILGVLAILLFSITGFASPTYSIFVKDAAELQNLQQNLESLKTELGADNPQVDSLIARASRIAEMNNRCSMISINDVLDEECGHFYSVDLPEFEAQYMDLTGELRLNSVKLGSSLAERTEQIQVCANALGGILVSKEKLLKLDGSVDLEPLDLAGAFDATYDFNLYFDANRMNQQKNLMERWVEKCSEVVIRKAHDEFAPLFVDRIKAVNDSLAKTSANVRIVLEPEYLDFYLDLNKTVAGAYFLNGAQLFNVEALPMGRSYSHIIVSILDKKVEMPLGTDGKMQNFRGRVEFTAAYQERDLMGRWFWGNKKAINRARVKGEISSIAIVGDSTRPAPIVKKLASLDTTALISSKADPVVQDAANAAAKDASAAKDSGSKKSWIPPAIAGAVMIGGGVMAAVFNNKAKSERDKTPKSQKDYDDICDKIDNAQTVRAVGLGIAAVGLVGLGVTLLF